MKVQARSFFWAKIVAVVASAIVCACGPNTNRAKPVVPDRSAIFSSLEISDIGENYRCPYSANVVLKDGIAPGGGFDYTGKNDFTVCVSRNAVNSFLIEPNRPTASAICAYPMHQGSSGAPQLVEAPKCSSVSGSAGIEMSFNSKDINYMAIVDVSFTDAMNSCLSGTAACPSHSEGFVQ